MRVFGNILTGALILGFLFFSSCSSKKNEPGGQKGGPKAVMVNGMVVQKGLLENKILSTGSLEAN